jgi:hypothetical protein
LDNAPRDEDSNQKQHGDDNEFKHRLLHLIHLPSRRVESIYWLFSSLLLTLASIRRKYVLLFPVHERHSSFRFFYLLGR